MFEKLTKDEVLLASANLLNRAQDLIDPSTSKDAEYVHQSIYSVVQLINKTKGE